jgi:fructokinase
MHTSNRGSRNVIAIGETVWDIVFRNGSPVAARAGGSMLNSAVSLGRAGIPVTFISETGNDEAGNIILGFLEKNNVATGHIQRYDDGKTVIALSFLDENGNAQYSFYRSFPRKRLTLRLPEITGNEIVLFGSYYSVAPGIRETLEGFIRRAREKGALILYDPNFRRPHLNELPEIRPRILENISMADIVRGSDEDFLFIFGAENAKSTMSFFPGNGSQWLVYSRSNSGLDILGPGTDLKLPVMAVDAVSTIGAGDAFNAGLIAGLVAGNITREDLPGLGPSGWEAVAALGMKFAADVCKSLDNYISPGFTKTIYP